MAPILPADQGFKFELPEPKCQGLCLGQNGTEPDPIHVECWETALNAAAQAVIETTGRAGYCPVASTWCVPRDCMRCPNRCVDTCNHDLVLNIAGIPVGESCLWLDGAEVTSGWQTSANQIHVNRGLADHTRFVADWEPAVTETGQWSPPPAGSGLVWAGYVGEPPSPLDLMIMQRLACEWAMELAGICNDKDRASSVTQSGDDGSVTFRFDQKTITSQAERLLGKRKRRGPGAVLVMETGMELIEEKHSELVPA